MYLYIYIYMYVYIYIYLYIYVHTCIHAYIQIFFLRKSHISLSLSPHTHMHTYTPTYIHTHLRRSISSFLCSRCFFFSLLSFSSDCTTSVSAFANCMFCIVCASSSSSEIVSLRSSLAHRYRKRLPVCMYVCMHEYVVHHPPQVKS